MMQGYIHERPDWPRFHWDTKGLGGGLSDTHCRENRLARLLETLAFEVKQEVEADALTREVLGTSGIEEEALDPGQVRSSIASRLGMDPGKLSKPTPEVEGIVEITVDATGSKDGPMTKERLFTWHSKLFPEGRSGLWNVEAGAWRTQPVEVVSGPVGRERVHLKAPEAARVPGEMEAFLNWFNTTSDTDKVLRAGLAHLWFVTIHPFEDGNGRIARAITAKALAHSLDSPVRFYSMSDRILRERADYYRALEMAGRGATDITAWLGWFVGCLGRAMDEAWRAAGLATARAAFRERLRDVPLNVRQRRLLGVLTDEPQESLTVARCARIAHCNVEEAQGDVRELVSAGLMELAPGEGPNPRYRLVWPR